MIASLLLTAVVASMIQVAPASESITIIAQRIKSAEDNLNACLARNCEPDEDIDATMALAETQLMAGEYRDARETLVRSLRRNKDEADRYPIPVSDLYRANGKVSAHLGIDDDYYRSTWGIYQTLKHGLPSAADRRYSALMEVAEMTFRTRGHERARLHYAAIARQAREDGRPDIAAIAELRSAIRHLPPGSVWQVNEIKRVANLRGEEMRAPVLEANLALARMAYEKGDEQKAQEVLQNLAHLNIKRPILVYVPPFEVIGAPAAQGEIINHSNSAAPPPDGGGPAPPGSIRAFASNHMALNVEDEWLDVGFRITPEGRVADMKVLRRRGDNVWAPPLLKSIQGRRYTPGMDNDPGSQRVERYTYTSGVEMGSGRRVATHSPKGRIEYLDLSPSGLAVPDS